MDRHKMADTYCRLSKNLALQVSPWNVSYKTLLLPLVTLACEFFLPYPVNQATCLTEFILNPVTRRVKTQLHFLGDVEMEITRRYVKVSSQTYITQENRLVGGKQCILMDRVTLGSPWKPNSPHSRLLDWASVWFVWFDYEPPGQEFCLILCSLQHLAHCWHHEMPKNTQSLWTNNKTDFPTQRDEVSVIFMPVFFLIRISYLCLESKLHVLLNHLWTDLLFRKCRHEVEYFSTTSFGNTDCWKMLGYTKGKCFWKNRFFSAVMRIPVSQGFRLVSRCDRKTSRALRCKHFTLASLFLRKRVSFSAYSCLFNCTSLIVLLICSRTE